MWEHTFGESKRAQKMGCGDRHEPEEARDKMPWCLLLLWNHAEKRGDPLASWVCRESIRKKRDAVLGDGRFTDTWIKQRREWLRIASRATLLP
jgi:hypothetical protein